ncbi:hypothetical protein FRX31_023187 [Thalictrum thalictroides]|uniref:Uncharacterized protein n=1 Tax=Thalictrum thalictroides TaxID=46969 RepID=A0A7J6VQS6_THATH|nr:hypothetical protein FRX31_023187 [Thalictrum thalictroides]
MELVTHNNGNGSFLVNWPRLNNRGLSEATWSILPYTVLWVLWCIRNQVVFENGTFNLDSAVKQIKFTL